LTHALETPLGNNKIRGVSGGEKKRVTIAEMFMGKRASINLLDNITRGLDAAVSLEILKNFRLIASLRNETFICTMQQLSDEMYFLFDKGI
jgi:ABC-type multidrug transport system ATPase subunit